MRHWDIFDFIMILLVIIIFVAIMVKGADADHGIQWGCAIIEGEIVKAYEKIPDSLNSPDVLIIGSDHHRVFEYQVTGEGWVVNY